MVLGAGAHSSSCSGRPQYHASCELKLSVTPPPRAYSMTVAVSPGRARPQPPSGTATWQPTRTVSPARKGPRQSAANSSGCAWAEAPSSSAAAAAWPATAARGVPSAVVPPPSAASCARASHAHSRVEIAGARSSSCDAARAASRSRDAAWHSSARQRAASTPIGNPPRSSAAPSPWSPSVSAAPSGSSMRQSASHRKSPWGASPPRPAPPFWLGVPAAGTPPPAGSAVRSSAAWNGPAVPGTTCAAQRSRSSNPSTAGQSSARTASKSAAEECAAAAVRPRRWRWRSHSPVALRSVSRTSSRTEPLPQRNLAS
mmetsp:Transcript_18081/g.56563  ORF Transcript_18081/g.56563 Transcript_18081/m.56563 type:complete len:314 (+) Transcript_18081:1099-2040(+)